MKIFVKFAESSKFAKKYLNSFLVFVLEQYRADFFLDSLHITCELYEFIRKSPALIIFHI